ncbi:MAG TPA: hypothetical protein VI968_03470 [archaeon]|nr:hypothetical protein [archaeon]
MIEYASVVEQTGRGTTIFYAVPGFIDASGFHEAIGYEGILPHEKKTSRGEL